MKGTTMPGDEIPGSGGFDFEELRKLLEQLGIQMDSELDFASLMEQISKAQAAGGMPFGLTGADKDPDAAWRTTLTAAKQLAREAGADTALEANERLIITDSERLAQSWLNPHTTMPPVGIPPEAMGRTQWLDETSEGWRAMVEPIIQGLAEALERGAADDAQQPQLGALSAMLGPMMRQSASLIYRDRLKKVLSEVAVTTLTGTEIGINLMAKNRVVILPSNVAQFTRDLELSETDIVLLLLLREAARLRLFHHVSWLSPQLNALLKHFAREIVIDFEAISEQFDPSSMSNFNLEEIAAIGEQVRGSFFKPASTPIQLEILGRLEVLLALIEGWVDHVTSLAGATWLPNAAALDEVIRRRRAAGGPAQDVFNELLGLDLRPRLVRDAENLWAAIEHDRGVEGRDSVWHHPDLLPTEAHLKDPLSYLNDSSTDAEPDEMDVELRKLLEGGS